MMIECHECKNPVSDQAVTCPHCGVSIAARRAHETRILGEPLATTQLTSKKLKKQWLIFLAMFFFSAAYIVLAMNFWGMGAAMMLLMLLLAVIGLIGFVVTNIRIWWHHK